MSDLPPPPPDFEPRLSSPPPPPHPVSQGPQAKTSWANLRNGQTVELASPEARMGARVLDAVFLFVCFIATSIVAALLFSESSTDIAKDNINNAVITAFLLILANVVIFITYEVLMTALKGQTLGKMATSIRVVRADNGEPVGWGKSIGRWIIPHVPLMLAIPLLIVPPISLFLLLAPLLVYVSFTWDRTRQGWHDKAAGTIVIKI